MNTIHPEITDITREKWKEKEVAFRSIDLFTTKELISEICNREGVMIIEILDMSENKNPSPRQSRTVKEWLSKELPDMPGYGSRWKLVVKE